MREIGEKVMAIIPGSFRNFVVVGEIDRPLAPHVWRLKNASMVLENNNGPDWPALARGENREASRFSAFPDGEVDIGPQYEGVCKWMGDLPPVPPPAAAQ